MSATLDLPCTECGRVLRVAEEHRGKKARCPACEAIVAIPSGGDFQLAAATQNDQPQWYMLTPEGQIFGPVDPDHLDRWVSEGRVTADCSLREGETAGWRPADERYPILQPPPHQAGGSPFAPRGETGAVAAAAASRGTQSTEQANYMKPHRGGLILVLGLAGLLAVCPVAAIFAWTMGAADLRQMRQGRMDPEGLGITKGGMILGMVISIIDIVAFVVFMFLMLMLAR